MHGACKKTNQQNPEMNLPGKHTFVHEAGVGIRHKSVNRIPAFLRPGVNNAQLFTEVCLASALSVTPGLFTKPCVYQLQGHDFAGKDNKRGKSASPAKDAASSAGKAPD